MRLKLILLVVLLSGLPLAAFAHEHDPPRIWPAAVMEKLQAGETIVFIDTRTSAARAESRVEIANSIPVQEIESLRQLQQQVPRETLIVTYCT